MYEMANKQIGYGKILTNDCVSRDGTETETILVMGMASKGWMSYLCHVKRYGLF